jgi:hypothetical protein
MVAVRPHQSLAGDFRVAVRLSLPSKDLLKTYPLVQLYQKSKNAADPLNASEKEIGI